MTDPLSRLAPVIRLAPAKLNLTLAVLGLRPDGYHDLHSVVVPLALADRLSVAVSGGAEDTLHVVGPDPGPAADNLVLRAIAEARRALPPPLWGPNRTPALSVRLEKRTPVAAGLGGGSSDGAAALAAAVEAWDADIEPERLASAALRLGSDVPFFLAGGPAAVEGRGERVTPLPALRGDPPGVLVVTPAMSVSTAAVFAAYLTGARPPNPGATQATSLHLAAEWRDGLDAGRLFERAAVLAPANDLLVATGQVAWEAVVARRALARLLSRPVGQSGSGPTCWVLYPSLADATAAATRVDEALESGALRLPGHGRPFVAATTIVSGGEQGDQAQEPGGRHQQ